jgi:secretion/DNA translocation related CpaE-like protein
MTRPLIVTADPAALDDLLRLAALAGVDAEVVADAGAARHPWALAPLVLVGEDQVDALLQARVPRRDKVVVVGRDLDDGSIWQRAVALGGEHVVYLPDAERWLVDALADAAEGGGDGALVAVLGGRGGAGATTLACALALMSVRQGVPTLLVDGDSLGGGIDLVFGGENATGVRWPDLTGTSGRVPAAALAQALPRLAELSVLSWDRSETTSLPVQAVQAVLTAGRRSHGLVVVDLPRHLDAGAREVLAAADTTLLVVPAEVRAAAAAGRVAAQAGLLCRDLRLVVRGPSPAGLTAQEIQRALRLPLAGEVRPEPGLCRSMEEGTPPALRRGSPLAGLCQALLHDLLGDAVRRAA